jgi:hypothetical protein
MTTVAEGRLQGLEIFFYSLYCQGFNGLKVQRFKGLKVEGLVSPEIKAGLLQPFNP